MSGINKALVVGRVGKDPEIRSFNDGNKIANFSIATSQTWRDKNSGERKEKTQWHNVAVRNQGTIKIVEDYVSKGSLIGVFGELETREWEKDGIKRYSTEIVIAPFNGELFLLGGKSDGDRQDSGSSSRGQSQSVNSGGGGGSYGGGYGADEEIPF
jgi:single-strand DNA-binding protein